MHLHGRPPRETLRAVRLFFFSDPLRLAEQVHGRLPRRQRRNRHHVLRPSTRILPHHLGVVGGIPRHVSDSPRGDERHPSYEGDTSRGGALQAEEAGGEAEDGAEASGTAQAASAVAVQRIRGRNALPSAVRRARHRRCPQEVPGRQAASVFHGRYFPCRVHLVSPPPTPVRLPQPLGRRPAGGLCPLPRRRSSGSHRHVSRNRKAASACRLLGLDCSTSVGKDRQEADLACRLDEVDCFAKQGGRLKGQSPRAARHLLPARSHPSGTSNPHYPRPPSDWLHSRRPHATCASRHLLEPPRLHAVEQCRLRPHLDLVTEIVSPKPRTPSSSYQHTAPHCFPLPAQPHLHLPFLVVTRAHSPQAMLSIPL